MENVKNGAAPEIAPQAMIGECIHALNLAAQQVERLGGDSSVYRETVERAMPVRWSA